MPVSLYVIIFLLLTNIATGGLWLWNRTELSTTKTELTMCQKANVENVNTVDSKKEEVKTSDKTCEQQLEAATTANVTLDARVGKLDSLRRGAEKKIADAEKKNKALEEENKVLKIPKIIKEPIPSQPEELTKDEAKEIIEYLDTPVPSRLEQRLHARDHRDQN